MVLLYVSKFKGFCHSRHDNTCCVMKLDIGFQKLSKPLWVSFYYSYDWKPFSFLVLSYLKWVYIVSLLTLYYTSAISYRFIFSSFIFNANKHLLAQFFTLKTFCFFSFTLIISTPAIRKHSKLLQKNSQKVKQFGEKENIYFSSFRRSFPPFMLLWSIITVTW